MATMQDRKVAQLRYRIYIEGKLEAAGDHAGAMLAVAALYSDTIALQYTNVQLRDYGKVNTPVIWERFPKTIDG